MRHTTDDGTLERNYIQKWQFWMQEYEATKKGSHPRFRFVSDFYKHHNISRQTFLKYYHRYLSTKEETDFLPRKRGPKWQSRRPDIQIETAVIAERVKGLNKYEICAVLTAKGLSYVPSPSGIYNICKRAGLARLKTVHKQEKRQIIKAKAGQLGHIDCHYLSKDLLLSTSKRYYVVAMVDSCTRLAWAEIVPDIKSLTVMFAGIKCINSLKTLYNIQFEEILSDNGAEFSSKKNLQGHPFERMLVELGIKHRYTRPYRPQTNGKIERFWRTLNEDMLDETTFESLEQLKEELAKYIFYYNEHRPHQALEGLTPLQFYEKKATN